MSTKIIDNWWTTTQQQETMGFVLTENDSGVRKIYCGTAQGFDEKLDAERIKIMGVKSMYPLWNQCLRN